MNPLHLLIPFAIPPKEHAQDLVKALRSSCGPDGLARLLARNSSVSHQQFDSFSAELPHEIWLSDWLSQHQSSYLQEQAHACGVDLTAGHWFIVTPVHFHIARNHLVLTDYRNLSVSVEDSLALYETAKSLCDEIGITLLFANATTWFLGADDWKNLTTSSPDAACGHNIEIWLPKGSKALAWRKLHNEIQMTWFNCSTNQQRESQGLLAINGLWLWSGTTLNNDVMANKNKSLINTPTPDEFFLAPPTLTLLDQLSSSALANEWGNWLQSMNELEQAWFKLLYRALQKKQLQAIQLHLSNSTTLLHLHINRYGLYQFWRKPTFNSLLS